MRRGRPHLRSVLFAMVVCAVLESVAAGELGDGSHYLFVSSEPFGARITVDGTPSGLETPALFRLEPGEYEIDLERPGHEGATATVTLPTAEPGIHFTLDALYVSVETPEEPGRNVTTLPLGEYDVNRSANGVEAVPRYPHEAMLLTLRVLVPATIGVGAGIAAWSFLSPPEEAGLAILPAIATQIAAGGLGAAAIALEVDRAVFFESWRPPESPYFPRAASELQLQAASLLAQGDIAGAVSLYRQLRLQHPFAPGVPEALYTEGRVASLDGEDEQARALFSQILTTYPTVEYYDRALVQLARLAGRNGDSAAVERYLSMVTFAHTSVTEQSVSQLRNLLLPE